MISVGIVGGSGYTGAELLRLLVKHPQVELRMITSRSNVGSRVDEMFPSLRGNIDLSFSEPDIEMLKACDVVFFATPNGTAMTMVPALLEADTRVIDLAADFRLKDPEAWKQYYRLEHACPELLAEAVYGLPEMNRAAIAKAKLVANPGCYPTAVTLGFLPLLKNNLVDPQSLIADAKSGVSGAGRQANVANLYAEVGEDFRAYAVSGHRHLPEIVQSLDFAASQAHKLTFVPHLLPMIRGIHATLYAKLVDTSVDLQKMFEEYYADEIFVDVMPAGSHPATSAVRGTNFCRMAVHCPQDSDTVIVLSVEDNLVKGAAGQAVQNLNIMFGLEEATGLQDVPVWP